MKRKLIVAMALIFCFNIAHGQESSKKYIASFAKMPVYAESVDKGILIDLVKAIARVEGVKIDRKVTAFARSMHNVKTGKADFHLPLIQLPGQNSAKLEYDHSSETIFHVNFVLYTNKKKNITLQNLEQFSIETDRAHTNYFDFKINASSCIECSLKKIAIDRIDGFIFADFASDPFVKKNKLDLKRQLYHRFDVKIILPQGGNGGEVDQFLTSAIKKLRASGEYEKIMSKLDSPYDNWQP
ncbi:MAG: transporter substrate-binding domain-containing protein [Deltaproteobacteria bacterium]|jgi:polar amino acid transport system substrate-binding protein|nr:transporter substrate-binding domain-containing protein [Deltaproteobacteria bacterium]MBT4525733.1 transporter substrate-binding domain-containing protein [Deltaproteobacteria bacterium]